MSAIWDDRDRPDAGCPGGCAYLFGGFSSEGSATYDRILRYNPSTDSILTMTARLPYARYATSAVFDGSNAFIFGGVARGISEIAEIVVYDPVTDTASLRPTLLPSPVGRTSAVFDGRTAFIFGGTTGAALLTSDKIVGYDPATGVASTLPPPGQFASGRAGTAAVRVGSNAFVFGGVPDPGPSTEIVRFDTAGLSVSTMGPTFLPGRGFASGVYADGAAYIFGGSSNYGNPTPLIAKYDPTNHSLSAVAAVLPAPAHASAAIFDGRHAYVFGGWPGLTQDLDTITRFDPGEETPPWTASSNQTSAGGNRSNEGKEGGRVDGNATGQGDGGNAVPGFEGAALIGGAVALMRKSAARRRG